MSNEPYDPQSRNALQALRDQLKAELFTYLDADLHTAGYIVAWICRNVDLALLEELVDELDSTMHRQKLARPRPYPRHS